jgi:hypothetical protein
MSTMQKATANPTKKFFVRIITRDISLEDCILDLVDNSVDNAWHLEGSRPMGLAEGADLSHYRIDITATATSFRIEDNCGGMTLDDAVNHAFSFGRQDTEEQEDYSIGVYGIGMKRAVFKLGTKIRIRSTFTEAGKRGAFVVPINVEEWLKDDTPPWDFDIDSDSPLKTDGVQIDVDVLSTAASQAFSSPAFLQGLRRIIARDYSLHINRGLTISLNGLPIPGWKIELLQSSDFSPMRSQYEDGMNGDKVVVEILAGMAAAPPDTSDPDIDDDGEKRFGWYVVCNGRIVLAADKTAISGWGTDDWPQWHRQYSGFIGLILFTSANAAALPLTTTKRSVDTSSEIFRRARPPMRDVTKQWIAYTNARRQALEDAKQLEAQAAPIAIYQVTPMSSVSLPRLNPKPAQAAVGNIAYAVPVSRLKKLAKELGNINLPYREVGIKSFEYTYSDLVGEE